MVSQKIITMLESTDVDMVYLGLSMYCQQPIVIREVVKRSFTKYAAHYYKIMSCNGDHSPNIIYIKDDETLFICGHTIYIYPLNGLHILEEGTLEDYRRINL